MDNTRHLSKEEAKDLMGETVSPKFIQQKAIINDDNMLVQDDQR